MSAGGMETGSVGVRRFCGACRAERDVEIAATALAIGDGWEARDCWCLHCGAFVHRFWTAPGEFADLTSAPAWASS